jgi:hypothetical protein
MITKSGISAKFPNIVTDMIPNSTIDKTLTADIMTPEEVALFLRKSTSWVYKNWQELGGRKLGGSLMFPGKEDLYERLFCQGKGVEIRLHLRKDQVHGSLVQNENQGQTSRSKKKGGDTKSKTGDGRPNRYGLLEVD